MVIHVELLAGRCHGDVMVIHVELLVGRCHGDAMVMHVRLLVNSGSSFLFGSSLVIFCCALYRDIVIEQSRTALTLSQPVKNEHIPYIFFAIVGCTYR